MDSPPATRGALLVPANAFAITFGLAGLAMLWHLAAGFLGAPPQIAALLTAITLIVWVVLVVRFVIQLRTARMSLATELTHPVTAPFLALIPLTLIVLVPELTSLAPGPTAWLAWICMISALFLGAWLTGTWLGATVPEASLHSGYYLPTVAAGLISGSALAALGQRNIGIMAVGLGGICWLLMGSIINNRNIIVEALPPGLAPTMAIDVAPVAVAGNAWFALNDGQPDTAQLVLAGFTVLMVLVQVRLFLLVYRRLSFGLSFWAFAFSSAAVASYALRWLATGDEPWTAPVSWLVVAADTAFFLWITVRSLTSLRAQTFFPRAPAVV